MCNETRAFFLLFSDIKPCTHNREKNDTIGRKGKEKRIALGNMNIEYSGEFRKRGN
jgi:hypothetical protein